MSAALRRVPAGQVATRAVMVVGVVGALLLGGVAGEVPPTWVVALVAATALVWALAPESGAGILAVAAVMAWWTVRYDDPPLVAVAAAACLLAAHLAGTVAGLGPPDLPVERAVVALWLRRLLLVVPSAAVVWAAATVPAESDAVWLLGALVAVGLLVAGVLALRAAGARGRDESPTGEREEAER